MNVGYAGLGAAPVINFGVDFGTCMKAQLASKAAGGAYNPSACVVIAQAALAKPQQQQSFVDGSGSQTSGGVPTLVWVGLGALVIGGAAFYFIKIKK